MKTREYNDKVVAATIVELGTMLSNERQGLFQLRQRKAMRQLDNSHAINIARKNIARILTEIRARELKG